ncbi:IS110 family transposase [Candidatus Tisiphia endosymbiont of Melanophora roralis]|uniref:IS110 family transposase n=1 Tax=Candidatus Tisiphia endosymbiont of Melanophora roralis TaxID=3066261 RepID=UPI001E6FF3E1|nr:MAG: IS110 family transposase [Rickettsia endosymbiont of Cimex lectularius]UCM92289.1 MAG: IS110 family transposase [Rickettsia endosymbiont of Cimex lectularius]UCM92647.1 MAG: IS110 family transposase [Rickettsia endosymbiont of Cimex lectularius]UCM92864.1 MAG: IS110 family transposase [Rickettsia endosymbiont of Cimex lectularius]UCM93099.1 MAG: IS110 family transposase [Rickettsia endosymbiont of Cimex lectularius]
MTNKKNDKQKLSVINPDAAGIDIGSREHYVCVPADRDEKNVRKFAAFTSDLREMADWLKKCGVKTIAMESTGIYWIPVFQILETTGFEVILVNARHVKNVPGRKTDVADCQWLQQLHSYGLLSGSFRPKDQICELRTLTRQRDRLTKNAATHVNRMQKALNEMNIQLHHVISDITGVTGMSIIKAIIAGERDANKLVTFRDSRIKSDKKTIIKALEGDYRKEHLVVLKQELDIYEFYLKQIKECDEAIESCYKEFDKRGDGDVTNKQRKNKNSPKFDLQQSLYNAAGADFTAIPGLSELSVQTIVSEVGLDMDKWSTEKHFTSWLGLSPANKITGGKVFDTRTKKVENKASMAFRMAALNLGRGKSALAGFYRRIKSRAGTPKAITATARKLACMFYRLLKYGQDYVEQGIETYEKQYQETMVKNLQKQATRLGFSVVKIEQSLESVC